MQQQWGCSCKVGWAAGFIPGWSTGSHTVLRKHCMLLTTLNTLVCTLLCQRPNKKQTKMGMIAGANNGFPPFHKEMFLQGCQRTETFSL